MASARSWSSTDCWARMNSPTGCAGRLVVLITSISPFHRRSLDHALGQGERRLMLHVLHTHALGPADKDGESVRTIDEVLDLQPPLLGLLAVVLRRIYKATNMEEHAPSIRFRLRAGAAYPVIARSYGGGFVSLGEAHLDESARGLLGRPRAQAEAFEVVVRELSFARNQGERESFGAREGVPAVALFGFGLAREPRSGDFGVGHTHNYAFDLPRRGRRTLRGVEEGELAEPATGSHEGVAFCVVHGVEPEVRGQEPGGGVPIAHVEGYMIQSLYLHGFSSLCRSLPRRYHLIRNLADRFWLNVRS